MTVWQPNLLWDASFQLSFAATLGLIFFTTPLAHGFTSWLSGKLPAEVGEKVVRVTDGLVSFLLTGDIESEAEAELLRQEMPLRSTVLKVAHAGSLLVT